MLTERIESKLIKTETEPYLNDRPFNKISNICKYFIAYNLISNSTDVLVDRLSMRVFVPDQEVFLKQIYFIIYIIILHSRLVTLVCFDHVNSLIKSSYDNMYSKLGPTRLSALLVKSSIE